MKIFQFFITITVFFSLVSGQLTTIAVVATNDIHGVAFPTQMQRQDNKQYYTYGGLVYMASLIQIIKSQNPGNTLILDAGDQFQGGIEASPSISQGKIMNAFYDIIGYNGSAIGNHQFDFGPKILLPYLSLKKAPTLAANIRSQKGDSQFLPNQKLSHLYDFQSGIKIGVIGLTTIFTPFTTHAFKQNKFPQYKFLQYSNIVIQQSQKLRKAGANAVLVLAHMGNDCLIGNKYGKWKVDTIQQECGVIDEVTNLIDALPDGTIDGILQGHRHKFAHHFHKGVPYLGSINGGYYFNVLYLKFQDNILVEKIIEGPIPVCDKVFENYGTCQYIPQDKLPFAGELVQYRFHNHEVKPHKKLKAIFDKEQLPKMASYFQVLAHTSIHLYMQKDKQCELANLVTSLIHEAVPSSDFVIINPGGFRTQWYPGDIQYQNLYNMFPFPNPLISFDITGSQLLQTLKVVQAGLLGFYPMYGVDQIVRIDSNLRRSFISATLSNGSAIQPDKIYRGLSLDFLLKGGDDFSNAIGKVYSPRGMTQLGIIRDVIRKPLQNLKAIQKGNLIDPDHPRLIVLS